MLPSASVRSFDLDAHVAVGDRDEIAPQAPGAAAVAAAHFQHVAKAARGDDADLRPAPLQQRVGADGGAVHDRVDRGSAAERFRPLRKPCASSPRRDGTLAVRKRPAAASSRNRSVKVPPTSTPTMTPRSLMVSGARLRGGVGIERAVAAQHHLVVAARARRAKCSRAARRGRRAPARASPDRRSRRRPASPAAPSGRGGS